MWDGSDVRDKVFLLSVEQGLGDTLNFIRFARLLRERGAREEWLTVAAPLLASVTNDKRNKLRHPLMKNVMEAKRLSFDGVTAEVPAVPLALIELAAARAVQRGGDCRLLEGTAPVQARALLDWLKAQGVNP